MNIRVNTNFNYSKILALTTFLGALGMSTFLSGCKPRELGNIEYVEKKKKVSYTVPFMNVTPRLGDETFVEDILKIYKNNETYSLILSCEDVIELSTDFYKDLNEYITMSSASKITFRNDDNKIDYSKIDYSTVNDITFVDCVGNDYKFSNKIFSKVYYIMTDNEKYPDDTATISCQANKLYFCSYLSDTKNVCLNIGSNTSFVEIATVTEGLEKIQIISGSDIKNSPLGVKIDISSLSDNTSIEVPANTTNISIMCHEISSVNALRNLSDITVFNLIIKDSNGNNKAYSLSNYTSFDSFLDDINSNIKLDNKKLVLNNRL